MAKLITLVLTMMLVGCSFSDSKNEDTHVAARSIQEGNARFTVISPTLIRMEYDETGRFEDRPTQTIGVRPPASNEYQTRTVNGVRIIQTDQLTLHYQVNSGSFNAGNLWIELQSGSTDVKARPDWSFKPQPGNLGGWRRGLDNEKDPQPLHEGVLSRAGWYLLNDTNTVLLTDTAAGFEVRPTLGTSYQDGYFFGYGQNYVQGLADLRTLTGSAPLLPKKALGVWFSKWWAYTAEEWKQQVLDFQKYDVPLDTISIDTDWKRVHNQLGCTMWNLVIRAPINDACSWNGWDWNRKIFPDPNEFVSWMHAQGIDIGLNVHPSIAGSDPAYPETFAKTGPLMRDDADLPCTVLQADPSTPCYVFDWTKPEQYKAYFDLHKPIEDSGIDFWWLDWCCEGSRAEAPGLTADTWINRGYARQHEKMGSRWPAFSRIGGSFQNGKGGFDNNGLGAFAEHRYSIHFTGDTCSTWALMAAQAEMTAAEGNIGLPYVSHDIGSFLGEPLPGFPCNNMFNTGQHLPDDMYVRWIQFGTFQPIMRLHSHHGDRLPWEYPGKAEDIATSFMRLRGQLVPTLYSLSREAHDTGLPMARALYLQWPHLEDAYRYGSQFTLGNDMLVATVAAPGDPATIDLWIPPGVWVDYFTGEELLGPIAIKRSVPLAQYAVFMRKGAILPLQPHMLTSQHGPQDNLTLKIWPGNAGQFRLYEDEGRGFAYKKGAYRWTPIATTTSANGACHTLRIDPAEGGHFSGALNSRSWELEFANINAPKEITLNGKAFSHWTYDTAKQSLTLKTSKISALKPLTLHVKTSACN